MASTITIRLNNFVSRYSFAVFLLFLIHCKKDHPVPNPGPGTFIGLMDGKIWKPGIYKANYYAKFNELRISAEDELGGYELICGVQLNPLNQMAEISFERNSYNSAEIKVDKRNFITDHNIKGGGGSLKILKLDTIAKRLSVELTITGFNRLLDKSITFNSVKIENIELVMFNHDDRGSFVSVDIQGINNIKWYSKLIPSGVFCRAGNYKHLTLDVFSGSFSRQLAFQIPLVNVGEYQLKPLVPPYSYCGSGDFTVVYRYLDYGYGFLPAKGTIKITALDTVARNLSATFNLTLVDSVSRQESIIMTNGRMNLVGY